MYLKKYLCKISFLILLIPAFGGESIAYAQKVSYKDSTRWELELPLWVPGFRGAITFGDITLEIGSGDGDESSGGGLLDHLFDSKLGLDYYLVGKVQYTLGKWQFQTDVFGGQIKHSVIFTYDSSEVSNTKMQVIIPRLIVSYRILDHEFKNEKAGSFRSWIYIGTKFFYAAVESTLPEPIPPIDVSTSWFDPIVGATLSYFRTKLSFSAQFDIAPFHAISSPSWWYSVYGRYRFGKLLSVQLGWVRQDFTRVSATGVEDLNINFSLQGPMAGVAFHF